MFGYFQFSYKEEDETMGFCNLATFKEVNTIDMFSYCTAMIYLHAVLGKRSSIILRTDKSLQI